MPGYSGCVLTIRCVPLLLSQSEPLHTVASRIRPAAVHGHLWRGVEGRLHGKLDSVFCQVMAARSTRSAHAQVVCVCVTYLKDSRSVSRRGRSLCATCCCYVRLVTRYCAQRANLAWASQNAIAAQARRPCLDIQLAFLQGNRQRQVS